MKVNKLSKLYSRPNSFSSSKNKSKFKCKDCGHTALNAQSLAAHLRTAHVNGFECEVCMEILPNLQSFKYHAKHKHKPVECSFENCNFKSIWPAALTSHEKTHGAFYKCDDCDEASMTKAQFLKHRKALHTDLMSLREERIVKGIEKRAEVGSKFVTCEICGKTMHQSSYPHHKNVLHFYMTRFECDICGKKIYHKGKLVSHVKSHIRIEDREELLKCDVCGRNYTTKDSLRSHKNNMHRPEPDPASLICHCGKTFKSTVLLSYHMKGVHMIHKYGVQCSHCDKFFRSKSDLKNHIDSNHTEGVQSKFVCKICGKDCSNRVNLNSHKYTHAEKNLPCNVDGCGKKFSAQFLLRSHQKTTHYKQRLEFVCSTCGEVLTSNTNLKRHVTLIHEKLRAPCPVGNGCKFSVGRRNYMRDHINKHTELSSEDLAMHLNSVKDLKILS